MQAQPVKTIDGVNFYAAMEDGSQTAEIRSMQATMYMNREFIHGLPLKVAQELYKEVLNKVHADGVRNETKLQDIAVLIHNLQVRTANVINSDNLFGLACIYFYIDGESPLAYDGAFDLQKYKLMKSADAETQLFFCKKVWQYTPRLTEISESDFLHFLETQDSLIRSQAGSTLTQ